MILFLCTVIVMVIGALDRTHRALLDDKAATTVSNDFPRQSKSTLDQLLTLNGQSGHPVEQHPPFLPLLFLLYILLDLSPSFIMIAEQLKRISPGLNMPTASALLPGSMDSIFTCLVMESSASIKPKGF